MEYYEVRFAWWSFSVFTLTNASLVKHFDQSSAWNLAALCKGQFVCRATASEILLEIRRILNSFMACFPWCEEIVILSAEIVLGSLAGYVYFSRVFFFNCFPSSFNMELCWLVGNLVTQKEIYYSFTHLQTAHTVQKWFLWRQQTRHEMASEAILLVDIAITAYFTLSKCLK